MGLGDLLWLIPIAELALAAICLVIIRRPGLAERANARFLLAGAMLALVVSSAGLGSGLHEFSAAADLKAHSVSTTGTIVRLGGGKSQAYGYVYDVDGLRYRGAGHGGYLDRGPSIGQSVPLFYDSRDPSRSAESDEFSAWHQEDESIEFGVFGLALPLAILIGGWRGLAHLSKATS